MIVISAVVTMTLSLSSLLIYKRIQNNKKKSKEAITDENGEVHYEI